jgi:threonylcarbamoyladenosine tRNA methylthiotransferase MtaB
LGRSFAFRALFANFRNRYHIVSVWLNAANSMATFYIEQFGCRATQADGAAIERQLLDRGHVAAADFAAADVIVVNTCTVTAAADSQARDAIRRFHTKNPAARLIVTGCYAQRAPEDLANLPGVSHVVGNSHKTEIASMASANNLVQIAGSHSSDLPGERVSLDIGERAEIFVGDISKRTDFLAAPVLGGEGNHTRPILKIQDGCNSRCAYCIIPSVRGRSRSLAPDFVLREIRRLSESGFREIVLSGINLGSYGRDLSPRAEFGDLLRRILDETTVQRLRISSIEPMDITQDLVALFAASDRIAQHFHMPLQSGSNGILAAMHRWYRAEHYERRVELVREFLPHAAIGADVITGFPGESEEDHAATLRFIERLPFTYLHVFSFSSRPGTRASTLPNQVPASVIKRRARELRALGEAKAAAFRQSQIGRQLRVLTLHGKPEKQNSTPALSTNYLTLPIPGRYAANQWMDVAVA